MPKIGSLLLAIAALFFVRAAVARDLTTAEKKQVADAISHNFKDPWSARFRWLPFPDHPHEGLVPYCGMVNAKNSFGAYVGFVPFQAFFGDKGGKIFFLGAAGDGSLGDWEVKVLSKMCAENGFDLRAAK